MTVEMSFVLFGVVVWFAFRRLDKPVAALASFLGGWLILPVGNYPPGSSAVDFAYWITGSAVPSPMWLTKGAAIPIAVLLGSAITDRGAWSALRWRRADAWVLLACGWPVAAGIASTAAAPDPSPWISTLYLGAAWGGSWLIGRLYFATGLRRETLAQGLVWSTVACLPFAVLEGLAGLQIYGWFFDPHPFRDDGFVRLLSYRPLGFFENGNQYGIWVALGAAVAPLLAMTSRGRDPWRWVVVALAVVIALASQSLGALTLAIGCWTVLAASRWVSPRVVGLTAVVTGATAAIVYLSGVLPIQHWARSTAAGRELLEVTRAVRMGSFAWRVSQDQKVLPVVREHPVVGHGRWDWWSAMGTRPWGLAMQLAGQFGLVGAAALLGLLLVPAIGVLARAPRGYPWTRASIDTLLALIVCATVIDALLNSFIYMPGILIAGALASTPRGGVTA